jgi:uncharacterized membrane protein
MTTLTSKLAIFAVGATCLLANPGARADIIFCNNFAHSVYVAIAYQQQDGSWVSRGWLSVDTGQCSEFDSAIRVKTFYYRAESVPFRDKGREMTNSWGIGDTKFAIYENSNFNYWNAQTKILNSTLASFAKSLETTEDAISVTVTFDADGIHSLQTTHSKLKPQP